MAVVPTKNLRLPWDRQQRLVAQLALSVGVILGFIPGRLLPLLSFRERCDLGFSRRVRIRILLLRFVRSGDMRVDHTRTLNNQKLYGTSPPAELIPPAQAKSSDQFALSDSMDELVARQSVLVRLAKDKQLQTDYHALVEFDPVSGQLLCPFHSSSR